MTLPLDELEVYMRSMRVDCGRVRIGSDDELDEYMDGSAGSVGRIMAPLLGVPERFHADFGHLGQAFQLTNFIRDVARGLGHGPDLPPGLDDPSDLGAAAPRHSPRPARRRSAGRWRGRVRCSRPPSPPWPPRPGLGPDRHPARLRRLRADPRPRRGGAAATCSAAASASASATILRAAVRR